MAHQSPVRTPSPSSSLSIPDKLYFRIGEVARLCDLPTYVLRFWETEFPQLRPNKGGTGQRLFRQRDVEMAWRIKSLLYDEGYTIPGARQILKSEQKEPQLALNSEATPALPTEHLERLRRELRELLTVLSDPQTASRSSRRQRAVAPAEPHTETLFAFGTIPAETRKEETEKQHG